MDINLTTLKEVFIKSGSAYWDYFLYQLQNPSWNNPFYIILTIYFLTFSLEVLLPKKEKYPLLGRKGFKLDLMYLLFIDFVFSAIGFYAITSVVEYLFVSGLGKIGISLPLVDVNVLNVFLQFVIFFILADFFQFLGHYILHRSDFFWKFHKIHHAQEQLGFASTRHFHWMEYMVFKPLLFIPFGFLGYSAQYYVIFYLWIGYFFNFLAHCNIKLNWGIFNYIVINPETHFWHHAKNSPGRFGVNFASVLPVWDLIFGTFYLPEDKKLKPKLGVHDQKEIPQTFMGQMIYPFKQVFRFKKDQHQGIPADLVVHPEFKSTPRKKSRKKKY